MSINRRLSWSQDGAFISTTGGRIKGEYVVPLIGRSRWDEKEGRSTWKLAACLAGHSSSINISRINPRLYRAEGSALGCYSIVAIASQDSTISVWKPQLQKPVAVPMDCSMMGVTDLSWGFNGNILMSSSHDGKVTCFHFVPGALGIPLQEHEKREIIEKEYGNQVLQDYIKDTKTQKSHQSDMNQLAPNAETTQQKPSEQKVTINPKTGKKKIVPKIERVFDESTETVNPRLDPFKRIAEDQVHVPTQQVNHTGNLN